MRIAHFIPLFSWICIPVAAKQHEDDVSIWSVIKSVVEYAYVPKTSKEADDDKSNMGDFQDFEVDAALGTNSIRVFAAGLARTGSSSLMAAMKRLGVKPYHMTTGVMETPGHLDAWAEVAELELAGKSAAEARAKLVYMMERDGFNATMDMPAIFIGQELVLGQSEERTKIEGGSIEKSEKKKNPTKVILNLRHERSEEKEKVAWAESVLSTIGQNMIVMRKAPWTSIGMFQKMLQMNYWMWGAIPGVKWNHTTGELSRESLEEGYVRWNRAVRETYSKGGDGVFLEHRPTDGWKPLCAFLTSDAGGEVDNVFQETVAKNCAEVLESGEPYPHVNESEQMKNIYKFLFFVAYLFEQPHVGIALVVSILSSWFFLRRMLRKMAAKKKSS